MCHEKQRFPQFEEEVISEDADLSRWKEAYLKFISDNIVYPEQALINKVEGLVYVAYTVNNIGEIVDIVIEKGIGYGCDEEAIRVIRLMKYSAARNRGVKMKVEVNIL